MKSYEEMMEAMSLKDMKDLGGTAAQKKIAQDRQKAREAKNRGFDPKKEVLKDKPSSMVKAEPKAITKKPDLRKSQLGKWSQGVKNSPGKLAKKSGAIVKAPESKPTAPDSTAIVKRDDIKNVDVKDNGPVAKDEKQAGNRPGTSRDVGKGVVNNMKKKKEDGFRAGLAKELKPDLSAKARNKLGKKVGKAIKNAPGNIAKAAGKVAKGALGTKTGETGVSQSGDLEGLSGRDKGLIG